ncbi:uncharacterized protein LOC134840766 isoform X4 [Symsagittifera roscoffensis]|uniref:uncharacterized protein LOC134840766 isoform X4 n=1 Tax=Symsagittifera roscoffensis TaxID=84072 RepID=UPI00307CA78E
MFKGGKSRPNISRSSAGSRFEMRDQPPPEYNENEEGNYLENEDEYSGNEDNNNIMESELNLKDQEGNDRKLLGGAADLADKFSNMVNLRRHVQKWASCVPSKRKIGIKKDGSGTVDVPSDRFIPVSGYVKLNEMGICELGSDVEDELLPVDSNVPEERDKIRKHNASITQSQALLHYFAKLARSDDIDEEIDMAFVDGLIKSGADVNTRDVFGQSLLHEVARAWHTSVAEYLIDKGADVSGRDYLGRTPLHVAAAVDYPDMLEMLLESGGILEAQTFEENQTPLHFAARNDASNALLKLIKCRADLEAQDYKGRTPLFVAAELDRSDTARMLLEYGANAGVVDKSGMAAIVLMVRKMSPVAKEALDQFHKKDRANRKQMFYLDKLEHVKADQEEVAAQSALQVIVDFNKLDLIMHPIFEKLIEVKWAKFGLKGALFQLSINLLFVASWTVQALAEPSGEPWKYSLPDDVWRIALYRWYKWRKEQLEKDFKYVHQRWPEEENYLRLELHSLQDQEPSYFYDLWNWFDWVTYFILLIQLIMHVVDILFHHSTLTDVQRGTFSVAIILIWVRLMKNFRAFRQVGPFIVICTYMIKDIFRWLFVYLIFYIPYCVAFYMIFGQNDIEGYETFNLVMYSLFRMTLVDDYNYDGLASNNLAMAQILCGSFLAISAIVMLNLFIALMSDTFQRVYDNAIANALLQQANFIQSEEEGLRDTQLNEFRDYIHSYCSPLKEYYDDDWEESEDDLKKVTIQIKEKMDEYLEKAEDERRERDIGISDGELPQDLKLLCDTVQASMKGDGKKVKKEISQLRKEVAELRQILVMMTSTGVSGGRGGAGMKMERRNPSVAASEEQNSGRYSKRASSKRDGSSDADDSNKSGRKREPERTVSGTRRTDKLSRSNISKTNLISPSSRKLAEVEEDEDEMSSREFYDKSGESGEESDLPLHEEPPLYMSKEGLTTAGEPSSSLRPKRSNRGEDTSTIQRPRQTVRQIQVMPDESNVSELLARYQNMDMTDGGVGDSSTPKVEVRTRNITSVPPSYNSQNPST